MYEDLGRAFCARAVLISVMLINHRIGSKKHILDPFEDQAPSPAPSSLTPSLASPFLEPSAELDNAINQAIKHKSLDQLSHLLASSNAKPNDVIHSYHQNRRISRLARVDDTISSTLSEELIITRELSRSVSHLDKGVINDE